MSDIDDRIVPDLETRVVEVVQAFRDHHTHPANLALHAAGALAGLSAAARLARGHLLQAIGRAGVAAALMFAGHRIEGNRPGEMLRSLREG